MTDNVFNGTLNPTQSIKSVMTVNDGDDEDNSVVDSDDRNDSDGVTYRCDGAS